jgi:hypothetical protein
MYSDVLKVGLGALPSSPNAPYKLITDEFNSASSIMIAWSRLLDQTLTVSYYTLYVDDGFGVTFRKVYQNDNTEYLV